MGTRVRAKFRVTAIKRQVGWNGHLIVVEMAPVTSNDPASEDVSFWTATPSGSINMQIDNPDAHGCFELGKYYYVDFSEAPSI